MRDFITVTAVLVMHGVSGGGARARDMLRRSAVWPESLARLYSPSS